MSSALGAGHLDALREIGNIGAGTAATALSTMIGAPVAMECRAPRCCRWRASGTRSAAGTRSWSPCYRGVAGDAPGHMLVTMGLPSARAIAGALLGRPAGDADDTAFDEIELSALQEVGNILTSAYLGAMSTLTGLRLEPTPRGGLTRLGPGRGGRHGPRGAAAGPAGGPDGRYADHAVPALRDRLVALGARRRPRRRPA